VVYLQKISELNNKRQLDGCRLDDEIRKLYELKGYYFM